MPPQPVNYTNLVGGPDLVALAQALEPGCSLLSHADAPISFPFLEYCQYGQVIQVGITLIDLQNAIHCPSHTNLPQAWAHANQQLDRLQLPPLYTAERIEHLQHLRQTQNHAAWHHDISQAIIRLERGFRKQNNLELYRILLITLWLEAQYHAGLVWQQTQEPKLAHYLACNTPALDRLIEDAELDSHDPCVMDIYYQLKLLRPVFRALVAHMEATKCQPGVPEGTPKPEPAMVAPVVEALAAMRKRLPQVCSSCCAVAPGEAMPGAGAS